MRSRYLLLLCLLVFTLARSSAEAITSGDAKFACGEAAHETLTNDVPGRVRSLIISNCIKALQDKNPNAACDRVPAGVGKYRGASVVTCQTARTIL